MVKFNKIYKKIKGIDLSECYTNYKEINECLDDDGKFLKYVYITLIDKYHKPFNLYEISDLISLNTNEIDISEFLNIFVMEVVDRGIYKNNDVSINYCIYKYFNSYFFYTSQEGGFQELIGFQQDIIGNSYDKVKTGNTILNNNGNHYNVLSLFEDNYLLKCIETDEYIVATNGLSVIQDIKDEEILEPHPNFIYSYSWGCGHYFGKNKNNAALYFINQILKTFDSLKTSDLDDIQETINSLLEN